MQVYCSCLPGLTSNVLPSIIPPIILVLPVVQAALAEFRSGKAQLLVATDVAARGLHIQGLPYVVNYDFPSNLEAYIHRSGRTGRLATHGHCFSFFGRSLAPLAAPLIRLLQVGCSWLLHGM